MNSGRAAELCRFTVLGPDGKADLAVPVSTTVADLLPVLLSRTQQQAEQARPGSWVLQRLGEEPLDPDGTPETLDFLDGEQLHLRPAEDPLPELDFDDVAEGIASTVQQRPDRWRPEFNPHLFRTLSAVVPVVLAVILLGPGPTALHAGFAFGLGVVLLAATAPVARKSYDVALARLSGLGGCAFVGIGGLIAADGVPNASAPTPAGLLFGCGAAAVSAAIVLVLRQFAAKRIPFAPFGTVLVVSAAVLVGAWLYAGFGLTPAQSAGLVSSVLFGLVIFAPKITIRMAFLRGPQLPRTSDELQEDIEPAAAGEVASRTANADSYLSIVVVSTAAVLLGSFPLILGASGWISWAMVGLLSCAVLLRSRNFLGAWQRVALVIAGTWGLALVALLSARMLPAGWRTVLLFALLLVLFAVVKGAMRPANRRLLPIWGHLANIFDTCTALAVVPLLLQLLEVYAWARGLAG